LFPIGFWLSYFANQVNPLVRRELSKTKFVTL
jgi:hypothetical protein